ncbi:MAG: hypothetical protein ACRCT8_08185 [Lacipirellulaceae bacterium]
MSSRSKRDATGRSSRVLRIEACEDRRVLAAVVGEPPQGADPSDVVAVVEAPGGFTVMYPTAAFVAGLAPTTGEASIEAILAPIPGDAFTGLNRQTPLGAALDASGGSAGAFDSDWRLNFTLADSSFDVVEYNGSGSVDYYQDAMLGSTRGAAGFLGVRLSDVSVTRLLSIDGLSYRDVRDVLGDGGTYLFGDTNGFGSEGDVVAMGSSSVLTVAPSGSSDSTSSAKQYTSPVGGLGSLAEEFETGAGVVIDDGPSGSIDSTDQGPTSGDGLDTGFADDDMIGIETTPVVDRAPPAPAPPINSEAIGAGSIDLAAILGEPEHEDRLQAEAPASERVVARDAERAAAHDAVFAVAGWSRPVAFEVEGPSAPLAALASPGSDAAESAWGFWDLIGLPGMSSQPSASSDPKPSNAPGIPGAAQSSPGADLPLGSPAKPSGSSAAAETPEPAADTVSIARPTIETTTAILTASLVWTLGARRRARTGATPAEADRGAGGAPPWRKQGR